MLVGVVSDTHGRLPETIAEALTGVDRIIHAGDVGSEGVLDELRSIAPVTAVRGNMDSGRLAWRLPDRAVLRAGPHRVLVGHIESHLRAGGVPEGTDVLVCGHTHRLRIERVGGLLVVNPGSAGGDPRDGSLSCVLLDLSGARPEARAVAL